LDVCNSALALLRARTGYPLSGAPFAAPAAHRIGFVPTSTLRETQASGESPEGQAEPAAMLPRHRTPEVF
jgi:hypothetical protein